MSETLVSKQLLKDAVEELYQRSKVSLTLRDDANDYIDVLSLYNVYNVKFSEFDQVNSTGVVFSDSARTITWATGSAELITKAITLTASRIKGLILKGTDQNVTYEFSATGIDGSWLGLDKNYDLDEPIATTVYLKVKLSQANTITGIVIVYEND